MKKKIFICGGSGYIGRRLITKLRDRGHHITAVVRPGREDIMPEGVLIVRGNVLDEMTYTYFLNGTYDTFIQMTGTPHPSPWKKESFRTIDLQAVKASLEALKNIPMKHYIYISVAHPVPVMKAYQKVREEAEQLIRKSGIPATILRPFYVLGSGHQWPYLLTPLYFIMKLIPSTKGLAERMGLVSIKQMLNAMIWAVEHPPEGVRVIEVPEIRKFK